MVTWKTLESVLTIVGAAPFREAFKVEFSDSLSVRGTLMGFSLAKPSAGLAPGRPWSMLAIK